MSLSRWSWVCCWGVIFVIISSAGGDDEIEGMSELLLEHTFDQGPSLSFTRRGTLTIRSLKSGMAHFAQEAPITREEKAKLKALAQAGGMYRIRIPARSTNDVHVSAFTPACALYESRLSDILTVNVDQSGSLLGISMTTDLPYCHGYEVEEDELMNFNTTVEVITPAVGPAPETQLYVQKVEEEKAAKAKGQQADNRSFFAKYWMYLVPLFIFLMFVSNADPNQGGGGGR